MVRIPLIEKRGIHFPRIPLVPTPLSPRSTSIGGWLQACLPRRWAGFTLGLVTHFLVCYKIRLISVTPFNLILIIFFQIL